MDEPNAADSSRDLTGHELGDYRVLRKLGSGGMAVVYLAEQRSLGRQVALKALRTNLAEVSNTIERFLNEARAAASLVHANIVQIYEVGQADGVYFIAQEYVPGNNLAEVLQRQGAFQPRLVLDILRQVVAALCKAAEMGIVHRDIKPENVLLSHSGEVKVADFGLARMESADAKTLTQVGVAMGTPLYMSPEQIEGGALDARSDIYSLGVTSYHLLTGTPPYVGQTALAVAVQHLNNTPRPLENVRDDIPSSLARVVHRMFAKKPEQRFANPNELLATLRDLASDAAQEGWAEGPERWSMAEWIATSQTRSKAAAELGQLMQADTQLALGRRKWARLGLTLATVALLGGLVAMWTRPSGYLQETRSLTVETKSSAWAQLYHAKLNDSEAAWRAVWEKFPDADPFLHQLARQGIVRYYLLVEQENQLALEVLEELAQLSETDESLESLRAFTSAGLCIAHQRLGNLIVARDQSALLTDAMQADLARHERELSEQLRVSLRALDVTDRE